MITCTLQQVATDALAAELRKRGWRCAVDTGEDWEAPGAFCRRHGLGSTYLTKVFKRGQVIPGLEVSRSPNGRVLYVRGTEATSRWMAARKQKAS